MTPLEQLKGLLKEDKVIPVVGAGVSFAAAGLPGWKGTIQNGLAYASARRLADNSTLIKAEGFLNDNKLTDGANLMKQILNAPGHPFADWLEDLFGNVETASSDLIDSINNLSAPIILTTNYDDLLYAKNKVYNKKIYDWSQHEETTRALIKKNELLLHLHGIYSKPKTIILSSDDYISLNREMGYKTVLQKLWSEYHFLFIGCSRDGVMDEDFSTIFKFLNEWFPGVPHSHFILMQESELEKGVHIPLAKEANVQAISYGTEHNNLPNFINEFNPNWDKAKNRLTILKNYIQEEFDKKMIVSSGKITTDSDLVNVFLKDTLPNEMHWINSSQFVIIENIWKDYNRTITNKAERFESYQTLINGLVSVSDLDDKIALWNKNWNNSSVLNDKSFVELAILAYECLKLFPKDLLEEIRHRVPSAIHDYYFSGYLSSFVNESKVIYNKKDERDKRYDTDDYFFENLKRIISSLKGVLDLKANEVFEKIPQAVIVQNLDFPIILFVANDKISLCRDDESFSEIAILRGETNLPFKEAELVKVGNRQLVVGFTSKYCFYWNPINDLVLTQFYSFDRIAAINAVINIVKDSSLYTYVFCGGEVIEIIDFVQKTAKKLPEHLNQYIYLPSLDLTIGKKGLYGAIKGDLLYIVNKDATYKSVLNGIELWRHLEKIKPLNDWLNKNADELWLSYTFPYVNNPIIKSMKWHDKDAILLKCGINLLKRECSIILGLDFSGGKPEILFTVCIFDKLCLGFDIVNQSGRIDLICGYLATGDYPKYLVQRIRDVSHNKVIITTDTEELIPSDGSINSDIVEINSFKENKILALGKDKFFRINFESMTFSEHEWVNILNTKKYM